MAQVNLGFTIVNMVYAIINKVIQKLSEGEADEEEDTEQTDNSLSDDDFAKLAETKTELREMLTSFYATHGIAPPATLDQAVDTFFSDQLKLQANFATKVRRGLPAGEGDAGGDAGAQAACGAPRARRTRRGAGPGRGAEGQVRVGSKA